MENNPKSKSIVVLGSINIDTWFKLQHIPLIGETIAAEKDVVKAFGGKGAN